MFFDDNLNTFLSMFCDQNRNYQVGNNSLHTHISNMLGLLIRELTLFSDSQGF